MCDHLLVPVKSCHSILYSHFNTSKTQPSTNTIGMSFQTGREGEGVRSSADRGFKDKSAAYTVWKYFSWLILTALRLTEDVLMKGHWVFNSTITLSKQEQTEIRKHQVFQT